jgi:crossover junction endodeoxyribonuclease RusA
MICPTCRTAHPVNKDGGIRRHSCKPVSGLLIPLPWTAAPLDLNRSLRANNPWVKNNGVQRAKSEAVWAIRAAKVPPMAGAEIVLHYRPADRRRRDADNLAATLKVCQDALVVAGVLVEDSWVTVPASGQRIHPPQKGLPGAMWLELVEPVGEAS